MSRESLLRVVVAVVLALPLAVPAVADLNTVPTAWTNFPEWYPLTFGGLPARDFENPGSCTDPTNGGSAFTNATDISSGGTALNYDVANCNPAFPGGSCCGPEASAFWSYYNGGGPNDQNVDDDYLALRMRVNRDPRDSTGNCMTPSHWNFLHDYDGEGFKEWWYDVFGNQNIIRILFEDNASQQVSNDNPAPAPGTLINLLTSCAVRTAAPGQVSCGSNPSLDCFYSHSRVCGVPSSPADLINPSICNPTTNLTLEWFVEVQVPINFLRTNASPAQCCNPIVLGPRVFNSFPPPIHLFFSTSDSSTNPIQKDFIAPCVTTSGPCTFSDPTPVTLSYFRAERSGAGLVFEWSTASESGNVGFDLYAAGRTGWEKLTLRPVASRQPFSLSRVDYRLELPGAAGERFLIEDIDLYGVRRVHGPFGLDKTYGMREPVASVDWRAVAAEHAASVAARAAAVRAAKPGLAGRSAAAARLAELLVDHDGVYRIGYGKLLAAGFDFGGVAASDLALTLDGRAVPIRVVGPARFGTGSFVEFLGEAARGVYTRTNVYRLAVDPARALRMMPALSGAAAGAAAAPALTYSETATVDRNRAWSFAARGDDPWYDDWVTAFAGSPVERTYSFTVDHLVPGDASLMLDLWGMTDWAQGSDHHVVVSLNGTPVGERSFDGLADLALELPLPAGLLAEGENRLELALPVDAGVDFEVVAVNTFGARYPRALVARGGELAFTGAARSFTVSGLTGARAFAWQVDGGRVAFLGATATKPAAEGRSATFAARPAAAAAPRFLVAQPSAIRTPALRAPALDPSLRREPAQYLVIAHPDFIPGLAQLVAARRAEGLTVRVADVEKVYGEFGQGRTGPEAIRAFVRYAARNLGTEMVLLVGADTYDYLDYTGTGSISFVPTIYAETGPIVRRTPADALFGDLDGDDVPDLAVGRFPVRTQAELATLVAKTLAFPAAGHFGRLVAAADAADLGADFERLSEASLAALPEDWTTTRAYVGSSGLAAARAALISTLDEGAAWAQYFGHSASDLWSFSGLFTRADADALTNAGRPTVFAQWGCWNTFFVTPEASTLADRLLVGGDRGAVAVLGPAALASSDASAAMSPLVSRALFEEGLPLGPAVLAARRQLAAERPMMIDVIRGLNLLGDPALRLRE